MVSPDFFCEGPPGYPELPVHYLTYILPPNTKADSVSISTCQYDFIGLHYIYPAQPSVPLCSIPPWVPPDSVIYHSESPYPSAPTEVVNRGFFDGASVVTIVAHPLMYIPARREVYIVSNIEFDFFLSDAPPPPRAQVRGTNGQRIYDQAFRAIIENDEEIPVYYQPPMLVPEQPPEVRGQAQFPYPCQYTIVTNDLLAGAYRPFAEWLTNKGVPTCVVPLSQILHHFPGFDDAEKLRNYLIFGYQQCGLIWVLLGGDAGMVPFRYGWADTTTPHHRPMHPEMSCHPTSTSRI